MADSLIIDDDVALLQSIEQAAEIAGVEIVTADSWDTGLALFLILSPKLVIADYDMPGSKHGLQLLAEIRRLQPPVRLILMSGYLDEEDIDPIMALGVLDRVLTKGSSVQSATNVIDEVREIAGSPDTDVDWVAYGRALIETSKVSFEALDNLDEVLTAKIEQRKT